MPPARAWWSGLYTFVTTLCTALGAQYADKAVSEIGRGAWITILAGTVLATAGVIKAATPAQEPRRPRRRRKRAAPEESRDPHRYPAA